MKPHIYILYHYFKEHLSFSSFPLIDDAKV